MTNVKEFADISKNIDENEESTVVPGEDEMFENTQEFSNQYLGSTDSKELDNFSDKREPNNCTISADSTAGGVDFTEEAESSKYRDDSLVIKEDRVPGEVFHDVDSRVLLDSNLMANENEELKKRDLQKWIQSLEKSSGFEENDEATMEESQLKDFVMSKSDPEKGIGIETQTDWEWVNARHNEVEEEEDDNREEDELEEEEDEDYTEEEEEEERMLSFNSTKSPDLISCSTHTSVLEADSPICLPNVGPPKILQYSRESEKGVLSVKANKVSPVATKSLVGLCDFCQEPTKPLPTLEQESVHLPEELYCCEDYQKFLEMVLQNETEEAHLRLENEISMKKTLKSEKNCKGTILNKKELKKAKTREMRSKPKPEMFQHQQYQQTLHLPPQGYHSTRQMNTINYQLSSRRCLEEGWTVRTPYLEQMDFEEDIFEVEPGKRISLWRGVENMLEGPLEKFYDNGHKFFTIFADGTGNIFYPTGQLAVLITATQPCHFTYIINRETTRKRQVAAIFEYTGYGTCYHNNGNVRLYIDPGGGVEADKTGVIKRRWQWHQPKSHIHAPPLQPIHVALNQFIGIKVISQQNIQLNFIAKKRSCKINMGVNVKPVNVLKSSSSIRDENHFYLEDKKTSIECLLSKVHHLIQYAHSPKLERILPPIYLTNKTFKLHQQSKQTVVGKKRPKVIVKSEISSHL